MVFESGSRIRLIGFLIVILFVILIQLIMIYAEVCNPVIENQVTSDWKNDGSCITTNLQRQLRTLNKYDLNNCGIVENKTIYEEQFIQCDYCVPDMIENYSSWSSCGNDNLRKRTKFFIDNNYQSCCQVTGESDDCIVNNMVNITETDSCKQFSLIFNSPNKPVYSKKRFNIDVSSELMLTKLEFIDNADRVPRWKTLCKNCKAYNKTNNFIDGEHNLTIHGITKDGKISIESYYFIVDGKNPLVNMPRIRGKAYTNGSWYTFDYLENNLKEVSLNFDNKSFINDDCPSGKKEKCLFLIDLSGYNNQEILYNYVFTDIAGNNFTTPQMKIIVDSVPPLIENINYTDDGTFVYFNVKIKEDNFNEVTYYDSSEKTPRWRVLCSNLVNGTCEKKQRFSPGFHDVTLKITDKALNFVTMKI